MKISLLCGCPVFGEYFSFVIPASSPEAKEIQNLPLIINDCSATPQEIQPDEAANLRNLWNILTRGCNMMRMGISDAYFKSQNGGNLNGAIGRNYRYPSMRAF